MKTENVIEVNGRRYDASTGALLGAAPAPKLPSIATNSAFQERKKVPVASEKVAVRIVAKPKTSANPPSPTKAESIAVKRLSRKISLVPSAPLPVAPTSPVSVVRTANHARAHVPTTTASSVSRQQVIERRKKQRSINHAKAHIPHITPSSDIRKPSEAYRKHKLTNLHSPANHTKPRATQSSLTLVRTGLARPAPSLRKQAKPRGVLQRAVPSLIATKQSVQTIDEIRLARAQNTSRSPLVAHHAAPAKPVITPLVTPVAVQPVPVKPEGDVPVTVPAPQPNNKPDSPTDIFEHALANASHYADLGANRAERKRRAKLRFTSAAAGTLALVIIAAFATYQNTPGLQFKVASLKAGISTGMPNFAAAGFAYNSVHASNGQLTVGFNNVSGNYQLTQTNTNMSDSDMIESITPTTNGKSAASYPTIHTGNTTVSRLDDTGATWVSNGKWYTIRGTSALSDSQIESLVHNV